MDTSCSVREAGGKWEVGGYMGVDTGLGYVEVYTRLRNGGYVVGTLPGKTAVDTAGILPPAAGENLTTIPVLHAIDGVVVVVDVTVVVVPACVSVSPV